MQEVFAINLALESLAALVLVVLLLCIRLDERRHTPLARRLWPIVLWNLALLIADVVAFGFEGREGSMAGSVILWANFLLYIFSYMVSLSFLRYLEVLLGAKARMESRLFPVAKALCIAGIALVVVNMFNGMYFVVDSGNHYHRTDLFWLSQLLGVGSTVLGLIVSFQYRKNVTPKERAFMYAYQLIPICAMGLQVLIDGPSFLNLSLTVSVFIISGGIQVEQSRQLEEKDRELTENRIAIMLSQIQPHFLYNALSAIAALCETAPKAAKAAIVDFAVYLRGNMDSLKQKHPIPFERELKHTEVYIKLEKIRFGDDLNVVYDIRCGGFKLPALSLQPIVENAVHYGVGQKEDGGTVTIMAHEKPSCFEVVITDDGVNEDEHSGENQLSIHNVRHRIKAQCGGSLDICRSPEGGTCATLTIPKHGQ